jgi:hypothetical protein
MVLETPNFCRTRAAIERAAAEETTLPMVRQRHFDSAEGWERMAQRGEKHADRRAARNAAEAKAVG